MIVTGIPLYFTDRLTGGTGVAGVAAANTAGNAAAVPALIAAANPVYAEAAKSATLLVAACVVVTAIVSPILTAAVAKRVGKRCRRPSRCRPGGDRGEQLTSILIIADDLSGAADCAIAFAGAGRSTAVTLNASRAMAHGATVIAADTDTRRMRPAEAAHAPRAAWHALRGPGRRLYKKIDSTLRGNWAAEVAALQPLAGLAIVAPAFPATGRTVRDGRVFVRGVPLENTETWQLEHAARAADLQPMLEAAGLRTAGWRSTRCAAIPQRCAMRLPRRANSGAQALIVDAETERDLRALAQATASMDEALSGSAQAVWRANWRR